MSHAHNLTQQEAEPTLMQRLFAGIKKPLSNHWRVEVCLAAIASILIGVLFSVHARGGPISSDITLYMNIGMNGIRMPFVLNRYFNIFLQQIFVGLASHPLEGYHAYWGFIMGMTTFLIYIAARKALPRSNVGHGLLAVLIFYAIPVLAGLSGVIVVDMPAMAMMTAVFTLYILSNHKGHANPWLIGALGVLFYLAFKTKETTMPIAVLFIGLGWVQDHGFRWRHLIKNLAFVLCGILAGMVVFGFLSWLFIGDPLFGLRISDWREYSDTYAVYSSNVFATLNALEDGVIDDWYQGYWFNYTLLPFLLYLISGVTIGRKSTVPHKVLWLVPLAFTVLMILTINNRLGYEERFGLPLLPILSVLAPQFIDLRLPDQKSDRIKFLAGLAAGLAIVVGIRVVLRYVIPPLGYDLGSVVMLVYYPLLITLMLALLIFFSPQHLWHIINSLILISLLLAPIASNYRAMFVVQENQAAFRKIALPLSEFSEQIEYTPDMHFYASRFAFTASEIRMVKDIDELLTLFNVFFNASATRENFTYAENLDNVANDILTVHYDYVLLARGDWRAIEANPANLDAVLERYQPYFGPSDQFVFLAREH
jgi:hypothetical protein